MKRVIKSVSSDIAGTICDLGVNAPKLAMMKAFSQYNIPITKYQASIHMELRKYEHINSGSSNPKLLVSINKHESGFTTL